MELLALLVVAAAVVYLQGLIFGRYALRRLDYRCTLSAGEAVEGDEIELIEVVENRKGLPVPWLKAEITTSRWLDFAGAQSVVTDRTRFVPSFFVLRGYRRVERKWKVRCLKRGVFSIEKVVLVSTDLFGQVSISCPIAAGSQITVLPKPLDCDIPLFSPRFLSGDLEVRRHLVEDPFSRPGIREYTERDPLNRVHWKATAHEGRLMVYENGCTTRQNLGILLNIQSREFENGPVIDTVPVEEAIRVCAALLNGTISGQIPFRFFANANTAPGRQPIITAEAWGEEVTLGLCRTLACLRLESTDDFPSFLGSLSGKLSVSEVVIVTAYLCDAVARFAAEQAVYGIQVRVLLVNWSPEGADRMGCDVQWIPPRIPEGGAASEE